MNDQPSSTSHEGVGRVFGKFIVLALLLGALFWIARSLILAPLDGAEKQAEYFGQAAPPFGLALDSAVRLPTGAAVIRFTRSTGEPALPSDVLFLEFTGRGAVDQLLSAASDEDEEGGAEARRKEWEQDKSFDWSTPIKRGDIAWGAWSSKLLIERSFKKGGGWSEEARVDLSSPRRFLVLCVRWPGETPADEKRLRELLATIVLAPAGS